MIVVSVTACKKTKFSPEGPTDIRVKNISSLTFTEVIVSTYEGADTLFGTIIPQTESAYFRLKKAYSKALITAKIGGITYTTGTVNYTYMTVLGQGKFTYVVYIESDSPPKLKISEVIPEAPLD
jgi:hypothetical protein